MKTRMMCGMLWSFMLCLAVSAALPAGAQSREGAALVPARALMYAHTADAARAIPLASYIIETLAASGGADEPAAWLRGAKARAGVDLLDAASVARAGVDTSRPVQMAFVPGERGEKQIAILIPVANEKESPLAFVNLIKKFHADKQGLDLNPAISMYQDVALYQMMTDVFFAGFEGHLVLTNTVTLLKESIGLRGIDPSAALAGDPVFRDYREKAAPPEDINIFIRGAFFRELNKNEKAGSGSTDRPDKKKKKAQKGRKLQGEVIEEDPSAPNRKDALSALEGSGIEAMDYITAGLSRRGQALSLSLGASLNKDSSSEQFVRTLFRPGIPPRLLPAREPVAYVYTSLNLRSLDEACGRGQEAFAGICGEYRKALSSFEKDSGIDMREDFVKRFEGYVNIAVRPAVAAGAMDAFTVMLPMRDAESASSLWKKLRSRSRKGAGQDKYGETAMTGAEAFWFLDDKGNRLYALALERNLYFSNDQGMLELALSGESGFFVNTREDSLKNLDASVFLAWYLNLRGESWLKAMMLLGSFSGGPQAAGVINRLQAATVIGKMRGQYISLRVDVVMSPAAAR